jgi:hypothetical protein
MFERYAFANAATISALTNATIVSFAVLSVMSAMHLGVAFLIVTYTLLFYSQCHQRNNRKREPYSDF